MPVYNEENVEAEANLGEFIILAVKTRRESLGISQEQLAYLITGKEKQQSYISNIENGKKTINVRTMSRLFNALKLNMIIEEQEI